MSTDLSAGLTGVIALAVLGFVAVRFVLVLVVTPEEDLTRIRADLEGLLGVAGPGKVVIDIVHRGGTPGIAQQPPKRRYLVTLKDSDASTEQRIVWVSAGLFDAGAVTIDGQSGGNGGSF